MTEGFTVVGTPGDRRAEAFAAACAASGVPQPRLLPWTDVLGGAPLKVEGLLRIDSPGEDAAVDALLRGPGDPARVGGGARWYRTLLQGLERLRGFPSVSDVDEIAVMFDKRACHARLREAGVPVPEALGPVSGYRELRERMAERRIHQVFVKPAHGSSASGVVALRAAPGRVKAVSSAIPDGDGWRNSLRVRAYTSEHETARLIDALASDGLHVERWIPKASLDDRLFDLRVVVIGGEPSHVVVRTSTVPMTNLHLGGARGSLEAVRGRLDWDAAMDVCARAAACFPRSLMVGVDLLVGLGWRHLAVGEVNAFGDLLPGLTGLPGSRAEGLDTYAAQVRAALSASGRRHLDGVHGSLRRPSATGVPKARACDEDQCSEEPFPGPGTPALGGGRTVRARFEGQSQLLLVAGQRLRGFGRSDRKRKRSLPMRNMNEVVGTHDVVLVTLDTLRYDVAARLEAAGRTPGFARWFAWEERHAPGNFTFASHMAMLAGFLPTPAAPGPHPRLFASAFPGSETTSPLTWTYDAPDLPTGLARAGYHTACVGGVGFFNKQTALGSVLPGMFAESHWSPEFGVTCPESLDHQITRVAEIVDRTEQRLFLLLNVSALHQPNHHYLPGASGDALETHAAALEYVDSRIDRLIAVLRRPTFVIICSDHGTAYGEDGHTGHRLGHSVVWTVPYAEFVIE